MILALALLVRGFYFVAFRSSDLHGVHLVDQNLYRTWALTLASGDWLGRDVFTQGPLYAYLLGVAYWIGLPDDLVLVLQMLLGCGTVLLIQRIGARVFSESTGVVAGVFAALYGPFVYYECMLMKTFLSPWFTLVAVWALLRYRGGGELRWMVLSGASIGCACLLRESHGLMLLPIGAGAVLWGQGRTKWVAAAVLVASCSFLILPSALRNYAVTGERVAVTAGGGEVFYMAHGPFAESYYTPPPFVRPNPFNEHADFRHEASGRVGRQLEAGESSRYWSTRAAEYVALHPGTSLGLTLEKLGHLFNDYEAPDSHNYAVTRELVPWLAWLPSFGWVSGLGALGFLLCLRGRSRAWVLLAVALVQAAGVLLTYNFARFRAGLLPLWILLAAHVSVELVRALRHGPGRRRLLGGLGLVLAVALTLVALRQPTAASWKGLRRYTADFRSRIAQLGDFDRKVEAAVERFAAGDQTPSLHRSVASYCLWLGRVDEAREHARRALELRPDYDGARLELGRIEAILGRTKRARELFRSVLEGAPTHVGALGALGALEYADRSYVAAARVFQALARLQPRSPDVHYDLGLSCARALIFEGEDEWEQPALGALEQALRLDPRHFGARLELMRTLVWMGRSSEALQLLFQGMQSGLDSRQVEYLMRAALDKGRGLREAERQRLLTAFEALAASGREGARLERLLEEIRDAGEAP